MEFLEEVIHTELFVHAWSDGVNRSSAANFVVKFWGKFFGASADGFTFFAVWIPGVFGFGTGFLAEGGKGDLGEAIFNNFIACGKFVFFPVAEFASGLFYGIADFADLFVGEREIVDLLPAVRCVWSVFGDNANFCWAEFFAGRAVAIVLGALCNKEMQMRELFCGDATI